MTNIRQSGFVWCIFVKEVRDLLRDRRAVLFAFVLPLFLYPGFILFFAWKPGQDRVELEQRELRVTISGPYELFYDRLLGGRPGSREYHGVMQRRAAASGKVLQSRLCTRQVARERLPHAG